MKKAERIYSVTASKLMRWIESVKEADKEFNQTTDYTKLTFHIVYENDEKLTIRALNEMMKQVEFDEIHGIRTNEFVAIMRNTIQEAIEERR